jgi:hypothetical protein
MLSNSVSSNLDELFQDRLLASIASYGELRAVVEMTIHLPFVLIVTIVRSKYCIAHRASEMFDVIFPIESSNV